MTENEEKILLKIDDNKRKIERAVRLIEHHREQIRIYKKRGAELAAKLEQERLRQLYKTVLDEGCDIAALNAAIKNGDIALKSIEEETAEVSGVDASSVHGEQKSAPAQGSMKKDESDNHNNGHHGSENNNNIKEDRH